MLAPGLVLTAAHVLERERSPETHDAGDLRVAFHDGRSLEVAGIVPVGDADLDVVALLVPGADGTPGTAVVAASAAAEARPTDCHVIGFPKAGTDSGRMRPEYIGVDVLPVSGREAGKLALRVTTPAARDDADWGGLSGSGVFTRDGRLAGIVTSVALRWERRLHAVPITRVKAAVTGLDAVPTGLEALARLPIPPSPNDTLLDGDRVSPPLTDLRGESLFDILHHRHRAVPFTADEPRLRVLDDLLRETGSIGAEPDLRVLLLTGPAGSGKSRLAAELCDRIAAAGWRAGFVDHGNLPHSGLSTEPLLAVFDYPERSPEAIGAFILRQWRGSRQRGLHAPVRVVLVSRHAGETGWYERVGRVATNLDRLIGDRRYTLDLADFDTAQQDRHARAAFAAFCDGDGLAPDERPGFDTASARYDRPLLVHTAALLAARGKSLPDSYGDNETRRLLDLLINAEVDRMLSQRTDNDTKVFDDGAEVREALCVTTLTSPTQESLPELLKSTVYFADAPNARRHRVAAALAAAFPAGRGQHTGASMNAFRLGRSRPKPRVAPVEPDLIAAHLLATTPTRSHIITELAVSQVLAEHPDYHARLVEALVLAADDYPQITADLAERLAGSLSVLVDSGDQAAEPLAELLRARLPRLLDAVVRLANDDQDPTAGRALAAALSLPEVTEDPSVAETATELVARLRLRYPQPTLNGLGIALGRLAVSHWERLGAGVADPHTGDLAAGLRNLGVWLRGSGDAAGARTATQRSVDLYEALIEQDRHAHLAGLSRSLNNLAVDLEAAGGRRKALEHAQRVVALREELAEADPATYLPELIKARNNLGGYLDRAGRTAEALNVARQAIAAMAETGAGAAALARAVHNLAVQETEARTPEALATARRAVALREELAAANPAVHLPELAKSLHNLAVCLAGRRHRTEALEVAQRTVAIMERLAADDRTAYLPALATAQLNLAVRHAELAQPDPALRGLERAQTLRAELLAGLDETTARKVAVADARDSVNVHRILAASDRTAQLPGLAEALHRLALRQTACGGLQVAEALATEKQAADLLREHATGAPNPGPEPVSLVSDAFIDEERAGAAESSAWRNDVAHELREAGHAAAAAVAAQREVELLEVMCERDRTGFLPRLAHATLDLAHDLADAGQGPQALATVRRAVALYEEVQRHDPHRTPQLANAVWSASQLREQLGVELGEALRLCDHAVSLFERSLRLSTVEADRLRRVRIYRENLRRRLSPGSKP